VKTQTATTPASKPATNIRNCTRCGSAYDWRRSASSLLKMTYCGSLCEQADLGFTIEGLLRETVMLPRDAFPVAIPEASAQEAAS
jgi:hypothetical protein